jgi:predicted RNase H-like HicB family nuclease
MNSPRRESMLSEYIQKALEKARYKVLEDGTWFAEIPGFEGVWANATTVEECRHELMEVIEEWLVLKIRDRDSIPEIEGIGIQIKEVLAA